MIEDAIFIKLKAANKTVAAIDSLTYAKACTDIAVAAKDFPENRFDNQKVLLAIDLQITDIVSRIAKVNGTPKAVLTDRQKWTIIKKIMEDIAVPKVAPVIEEVIR